MTQNLSDADLSTRLRGLGVDVGPITSTTREVYNRKYRALLVQQPPAAPPHKTSPKQVHADRVATTTPATPPDEDPATPPALEGVVSRKECCSTTSGQDRDAVTVVEGLLKSFDNHSHVSSDTAFLFPTGEVIMASRAVLAAQCSKMIPMLYDSEVPYPVKVITLSGQGSEFMVRGGEIIRDLKEKICLVYSIPVPQQRLIFKQQELPDSNTFTSTQILSGATLHLVLVTTSDLPQAAPSYTCAGVSPTLSIHHFIIGLSMEQLACFTDTTPLQQQTTPLQIPSPHRVSLPPHTTHMVHIHDSSYSGFKRFLWYLYCRKLLQGDESSSSNQCGSCIMCYILGTYFELPGLVEGCLSAIGNHLTLGNVHSTLDLSKSIQNQPLQQLCVQFIKAHTYTTAKQ